MRLVPAGMVLRYDYVHRTRIRFVDGEGMTRPRLEWWLDCVEAMGDASPADAPLGTWSGGDFWVKDGRHRTYALLTVGGREWVLVCWLEEAPHPHGQESPERGFQGTFRNPSNGAGSAQTK